VALTVTKPIPRPVLRGQFGQAASAGVTRQTRQIHDGEKTIVVPVFRAEEQSSGVTAQGPAVLEEAYYTCRIDTGWRFEFSNSGDILLTRV
jgi:N-methylhydantoinase A/oxoprolinase/acetone carboxylase beta subunit